MPDAVRSYATRVAMDAYVARLVELIESCADHQIRDPEVFLWNARRALETVCHLLLHAHAEMSGGKKPLEDDRTLDQLISDLKAWRVLDKETHTRFDAARRHTNLGVHIRMPEKEDYTAAVKDVGHLLPEIVEWLFDESPAAAFMARPAELATDVIRAGGRQTLLPAEALREADRRVLVATGKIAEAEAQRDRALAEAAAARQSRWRRLRFYLASCLLVGVSGFAAGLAAGPLLGDSSSWAAAATGLRLFNRPAENAPAPAPAPVVAPALPTCPDGMLTVPELPGLRLAQPTPARKAWPAQVGSIQPVTVPAFCLDPQPPTPTEYRNVASAAYPAGVCRWDRDDGDRGAVYCLTRDEADAWCAESRPGGRLPSMLEWESAYRARLSELVPPVHEWTREPFPTPTLALEDPSWSRGTGMWVRVLPGEPPKTRAYLALSWNHQDPELRHPERTFRCAAALVPSTP